MFTNTTLASSMNNWLYIPFCTRCYFFIFRFPHVFRKFSTVNILFVAKISCVVSKTIFKWRFCSTEIFLIWFAGFAYKVKTIISTWVFSSISTIVSMVIGWIILRLWEAMTEPIFPQQLWLNFIVFLLTIFETKWCFGKWQLINLDNFLAIFVFTIFENGGLNHIFLRWHFWSFHVDFYFFCPDGILDFRRNHCYLKIFRIAF